VLALLLWDFPPSTQFSAADIAAALISMPPKPLAGPRRTTLPKRSTTTLIKSTASGHQRLILFEIRFFDQ
jgi:hypothetical protein